MGVTEDQAVLIYLAVMLAISIIGPAVERAIHGPGPLRSDDCAYWFMGIAWPLLIVIVPVFALAKAAVVVGGLIHKAGGGDE